MIKFSHCERSIYM